ncbi:MAG: serine O-acetyltransferase [Dermatophilaceae bacterium]
MVHSPDGPLAARSRDLLAQDLTNMIDKRASHWRLAAEIAVKSVVFPRIRAVVFYRASQVCARRRQMTLAYWLQARAIRAAGSEISPLADIGPGLCLWHSVGIVVGANVKAGRNLQLYQGVTLGDGARPGQPQIGDDVTIGSGAAVLGGVQIGDRAVIGSNAVVTSDIPSDSVAVGAPATWRPQEPRHVRYHGVEAVD